MIEKKAVIKNEQGIHCRPSAAILNETKGYQGEIEVVTDNGSTKLNSVMALLSLGLDHGREVTIRVEGPNEEAMAQKLVGLFEYQFDFPPRD